MQGSSWLHASLLLRLFPEPCDMSMWILPTTLLQDPSTVEASLGHLHGRCRRDVEMLEAWTRTGDLVEWCEGASQSPTPLQPEFVVFSRDSDLELGCASRDGPSLVSASVQVRSSNRSGASNHPMADLTRPSMVWLGLQTSALLRCPHPARDCRTCGSRTDL